MFLAVEELKKEARSQAKSKVFLAPSTLAVFACAKNSEVSTLGYKVLRPALTTKDWLTGGCS